MAVVNTRNPLSAGVYKSENDFTETPQNSVAFNAGYVGSYPWGPVDKPTRINSIGSLTSKFGTPTDWNYTDHFAVEDYMAYSSNVILTRVIDDMTFNAYSATSGNGLEMKAQVINGEVVGVTFVTFGAGYSIGDLIPVETTHEVVTQAVFEVTNVDAFGAIVGLEIVEGGRGYIQDDTLTPAQLELQVRNEDDFLLQEEAGCANSAASISIAASFANVIAKYPGVYGNSLIFSAARASEFESWEYKSLFTVAPSASVYEATFNVDQVTLPQEVVDALQGSEAVVTVDGIKVVEGVAPAQYTLDPATGLFTFNTETETFTGDDTTSVFQLVNANNIQTDNALVKVNGAEIPQWTGSGSIPKGYAKVNGNSVTFGVSTAFVSADGINDDYVLNFGSEAVDVNDIQVFVNGSQYTVVTTGTPNTGEVLVTSGTLNGNNTAILQFEATEIPPLGLNNIIAYTGFLGAADNIEISYNYPETGLLKVYTDQNEIHAVVVSADGTFGDSPNEVLETYSFLSTIKGTKSFEGQITYYKDLINRRSQFVWIGREFKDFTTVRLSGGTDSLTVGNPERIKGWEDHYRDAGKMDFTYLISGAADITLQNWLIDNILECRGDVFGTFSPSFDDVVCFTDNTSVIENVVKWRNEIRGSSYWATEGNWKLRYDQYNDQYRWLPLAQDTLGLISRSNQENGEWVSPAGTTRGIYKNYFRMAYIPTKAERDVLYPNDVNPVFDVDGIGAILYGDKTGVGRNSAFGEIGVRMLFIVMQSEIAEFFEDFLFEQNTAFVRRRAFNITNSYLRGKLGDGAMDDYRVVVDETNNTAEVINSQTLCVNIMVRPNRSINFVKLQFTNTRFGLTFDEIQEGQRVDINR